MHKKENRDGHRGEAIRLLGIRDFFKNKRGIGALIVILILIVVVVVVAWAFIWSQVISVNVSNFSDVWLAIIVITVIAGAILAALVLMGRRNS